MKTILLTIAFLLLTVSVSARAEVLDVRLDSYAYARNTDIVELNGHVVAVNEPLVFVTVDTGYYGQYTTVAHPTNGRWSVATLVWNGRVSLSAWTPSQNTPTSPVEAIVLPEK